MTAPSCRCPLRATPGLLCALPASKAQTSRSLHESPSVEISGNKFGFSNRPLTDTLLNAREGLRKQDSRADLVVSLALNPEHSAEHLGSENWRISFFFYQQDPGRHLGAAMPSNLEPEASPGASEPGWLSSQEGHSFASKQLSLLS